MKKRLAPKRSAQRATGEATAAGWAAGIRNPVLLKTALPRPDRALPARATQRKYSLAWNAAQREGPLLREVRSHAVQFRPSHPGSPGEPDTVCIPVTLRLALAQVISRQRTKSNILNTPAIGILPLHHGKD